MSDAPDAINTFNRPEDFKRKADECFVIASRDGMNDDERAKWVDLAHCWLELAKPEGIAAFNVDFHCLPARINSPAK